MGTSRLLGTLVTARRVYVADEPQGLLVTPSVVEWVADDVADVVLRLIPSASPG